MTNPMSKVVHRLRTSVLRRGETEWTDGELLTHYVNCRDHGALEMLVRRHSPMVWAVCRRVLSSPHDAEDAFQATFLVLVRKAASIAAPELVANWLYGVAHQTALKARANTAKRHGRERQVMEMAEPAVSAQDHWNDLSPILDEELSRLPDKYRAVIVLCELEGKTRQEAAQQLACPPGSVAGWLARARIMLAKRLTRRGVALSAGALALELSKNAVSASAPTSVVSITIKAATELAAGQAAATGAISSKAAALAEGMVKSMLITKCKIASALIVGVLACVGGGTLSLAQRPAVQGEPPPKKAEAKEDKQEGKDPRGKDLPESQDEPKRKDGDLTISFISKVISVNTKYETINATARTEFKRAPRQTGGKGSEEMPLFKEFTLNDLPVAKTAKIVDDKGGTLKLTDLRFGDRITLVVRYFGGTTAIEVLRIEKHKAVTGGKKPGER